MEKFARTGIDSISTIGLQSTWHLKVGYYHGASKKIITRTPVTVIRDVITDEMRDTERDPAAGGRPAAGDGLACRSRHRRRRVVEALGDELGELLHPHGYRGDSRARRRASAPTALGPPPSRESRRRGDTTTGGTSRRRRPDATRPPGRHSAAGQSARGWA